VLQSSDLEAGAIPRSEPHLNLPIVYRFFNDPSHADTLAGGKVWLSTLGTWRRYQDPKQGGPEEGSVTCNSGHAVGDSGDKTLRLLRQGAVFTLVQGARTSPSTTTSRYTACLTQSCYAQLKRSTPMNFRKRSGDIALRSQIRSVCLGYLLTGSGKTTTSPKQPMAA